jgi:hypothetical protein
MKNVHTRDHSKIETDMIVIQRTDQANLTEKAEGYFLEPNI